MTTAARPTWAPAKGGNEQGGTRIFGPSQKYSSRDIASHTTLKPRKEGQDTQEEKEEMNWKIGRGGISHQRVSVDRDRRKGGHLLLEGSRRDVEDRIVPRSVDADDADVDAQSDDDSDDDNDDGDDEEALLAELERLRKEKAEQKERKWDDDVVFKNQARGQTKTPKRFINDTIRNDFHRKFLQKYMKYIS
ncbi:UNVERIFIED_CONTAM: protein CWC15 [Sesamum latifolium]|uniref:Protein CWC15 n=1 Tax=Sesamum latifolium TaxID=2727402 RepID=A0AAW2WT18_9LAMI